MRLTQVLVVATASFLFASEAIAVTMDSNQAKISTVARGGPSQRLLRSYKNHVEDDSDNFDDSEERGPMTELRTLATKWGYSIDDIVTGSARLSDKQNKKWLNALNTGMETNKRAKLEAASAARRAANGIGR
ncbi:Avirulence protein (Avh) [Phytophthora palmivora]|uniref:RxLR effector protein n=1 Tax=Phytophthora palmivora TaxID=4796 RepID=A0A2P4XYP3_9STRA|nr:Avirulence protein (Avh) [Phytophthora palmivora]